MSLIKYLKQCFSRLDSECLQVGILRRPLENHGDASTLPQTSYTNFWGWASARVFSKNSLDSNMQQDAISPAHNLGISHSHQLSPSVYAEVLESGLDGAVRILPGCLDTSSSRPWCHGCLQTHTSARVVRLLSGEAVVGTAPWMPCYALQTLHTLSVWFFTQLSAVGISGFALPNLYWRKSAFLCQSPLLSFSCLCQSSYLMVNKRSEAIFSPNVF